MTQLDPKLFDEEQLNNLRELFNDGFKGIIDTYVKDFTQKDQEITSAVNEKNVDAITKLAHSLKGSSLNMGAIGLANACAQLETAARQGDLEKIKLEHANLQQIFPKTREVFLQLLA